MSNTHIKLVLFDLGGVLVELGDSPFRKEWMSRDLAFNLSDWLNSETALDF